MKTGQVATGFLLANMKGISLTYHQAFFMARVHLPPTISVHILRLPPDETLMPVNAKVMVGLGFAISVGLMLIVVASAVFNQYYPLFVILSSILAPLPSLWCIQEPNSDSWLSGLLTGSAGAGNFLTSVLVVSGFGIPIVLTHVNLINGAALAMTIIGGLIIYGSVVFYIKKFHNSDDMF